MNDHSSLARVDLITSAESAWKKAADAWTAATADLAAKTQAANQADVDLSAALRAVAAGTGTTESASAAEVALAEARRARDMAGRVLEAAETIKNERLGAVADAKHEAYIPVLARAAAESVAAAEDFAAAIQAMGAALERKRASGAIAREAVRGGARLGFDGGRLDPLVCHFTHPRVAAFTTYLADPSDERVLWEKFL